MQIIKEKLDIDNLKEKNELEMEANEKDYNHEIEMQN